MSRPIGRSLLYPDRCRLRRIVVGGVAALACLAVPAVAQAGTLGAVPSPVQFGTQIAGNGGGSQNVTITNDNTSATTIGTLSFSGPDAKEFQLNSDSCSGQTLVTMGQCNVNVQWNPQIPGVKSAQLNVANDGSINPLSVSLQATALVGPLATLSPGTVSFPDTAVGGLNEQTVTLTNTGDSDLFVGEMFVVTGTPQVFPITSNGCGGLRRIAPAASCQFTVGFQPIAGGSKEATVFLITGAQTSPVTVLPMTGNGIVPAPAPGPTPIAAPQISNLFAIVGRALDTRNGSATLTVQVPGPGRLDAVATAPTAQLAATNRLGSGIVAQSRASAPATPRVKLVLTPSRRAKSALKRNGRLRVSVKITYAPTGGTARSMTIGLTLKLKRGRRR